MSKMMEYRKKKIMPFSRNANKTIYTIKMTISHNHFMSILMNRYNPMSFNKIGRKYRKYHETLQLLVLKTVGIDYIRESKMTHFKWIYNPTIQSNLYNDEEEEW